MLQCLIRRFAFFFFFVIKTEILSIIVAFYNLQTKHKAADKTLEQCFLKEIKATCKNSGDSELKQQKAVCRNALYVGYAPNHQLTSRQPYLEYSEHGLQSPSEPAVQVELCMSLQDSESK